MKLSKRLHASLPRYDICRGSNLELGKHCFVFPCRHCWATRAACTEPVHLTESAAPSGSSRL